MDSTKNKFEDKKFLKQNQMYSLGHVLNKESFYGLRLLDTNNNLLVLEALEKLVNS